MPCLNSWELKLQCFVWYSNGPSLRCLALANHSCQITEVKPSFHLDERWVWIVDTGSNHNFAWSNEKR